MLRIRLMVVVLLVGNCFAQASPIDSLMKVLAGNLADTALINTYTLLGKQYTNVNSDSALKYANAAYDVAKKIGDTDKMGTAANTLGTIYINKAQYDKALQYHLEALKLFEKTGNKRGMAFTYNNIGSVNFHTLKYNEALEYYQKSLDMKLLLNLQKDASSTYINMASVFMKKKNYDSCILYYNLALENSTKFSDENNVSISLMNLGEAYIDKQEYGKARQYYNRAIELNLKRNNLFHQAQCYYALGKILAETKEYAESEKSFLHALEIAKKSGIKTVELNIYRYISRLYEKMGDNTKALKYYKDFQALNDTIYNTETAKKIEEMKARYESELKDKQITALNAEKGVAEEKAQREKTSKNSLIIAIGLIAVICIILLRNMQLKQKSNRLLMEKNKQIEQHQHEIELKNKELNEYNVELMRENISARYEVLKSKINPHFLFNSLSTLSTLIIKDQKQALDFVGKFSKLYRHILRSGDNKLVTLDEELDFAGHYLYLQKMRFGDNLVVSIDVPKELLHTYVPPFTLQLLLENALKHNLVSDEHRLVISITARDGRLLISNNLQKKLSPENSTRIGQQNIIERYRMLSEELPEFIEKTGYYIASIPLLKAENVA